MDNEMITVREIAKYLRISLPSAYKLINTGTIPHVKVGYRYIIPREAFQFWVNQNTFGGDNREYQHKQSRFHHGGQSELFQSGKTCR